MRRLLLLVSLAGLMAPCGEAQLRIIPQSSFVLNLDYARFRYDEQHGYLEVYYGFYPRLITYEQRGDKYRGGVRLRTILVGKAASDSSVNDSAFLPMSVADTSESSFHYMSVTEVGYSVVNGDYTLIVVASDSLNPQRRDSVSLPVQVKAFSAGTTVSDVELCSNITSSEEKSDAFYKNSLLVLPNPTLVFGIASNPVMFDYAEVYNLTPDSSYIIKTMIVDNHDKIVRENSRNKKYGVKNAVEVGTINTTSIPSGRYRFHLIVEDAGAQEIVRSVKTFFVYNPHLKGPELSPTSLKATELAGLTADELADEFRKGQYFATDQEVKTFSQITNADGRREFLAQFWTQVEAGRLGHDAITRGDYLQRVSVANQRFRSMSRDGWKSDRGRIFVLYGEPDEVERHPSSQESKPYEIWHYYRIENGVEFVFVDRSGFNDYSLVHSTKRGELRDDEWQRFLQ